MNVESVAEPPMPTIVHRRSAAGSCPDCGATLANVQGTDVCSACGWTGA